MSTRVVKTAIFFPVPFTPSRAGNIACPGSARFLLVLRRVARIFQLKLDLRAFAAPDPVALHGAHLLRPAVQLAQIVQQFLRVIRDAQEPLLQIALLHRLLFVPPAAAVHHLLIGQHRRALRAPVHLALLAIRQPALVHLQKEPLIPAVVIRQTGRDLVAPVVAQPNPIHLPLHRGNVAQRPLPRRRVVFERGVFRRQSECVPPHRVQHVVALHPHVARQRVANRVVAHVPHVQLPRRIRQHLQHVVLRLCRRSRLSGVQLRLRLPSRLPARLNLGGVIAALGR